MLSREGEIAIAKRIEAGRELMIGALCESPLTFEALTVWRDELMEGKALLRDIIDLEAMYGGVPGADGPLAQGIAGLVPASCRASRRSGGNREWFTRPSAGQTRRASLRQCRRPNGPLPKPRLEWMVRIQLPPG